MIDIYSTDVGGFDVQQPEQWSALVQAVEEIRKTISVAGEFSVTKALFAGLENYGLDSMIRGLETAENAKSLDDLNRADDRLCDGLRDLQKIFEDHIEDVDLKTLFHDVFRDPHQPAFYWDKAKEIIQNGGNFDGRVYLYYLRKGIMGYKKFIVYVIRLLVEFLRADSEALSLEAAKLTLTASARAQALALLKI
ncbi:MAG: hypothetical protein V1908_00705 [Candidatus Peregrinibacteria bacterium]